LLSVDRWNFEVATERKRKNHKKVVVVVSYQAKKKI
jgi:P2-related tail formation protein